MKTSKASPITRRSLRHAPNGTKNANSKNDKASADQSKPVTKVKTKGGRAPQKTPPAKSVTPPSKRQRVSEETPEGAAEAVPASPVPEEVAKPSSNADQEETIVRTKARRPKKKRGNQQTEEISWRPLDDFDNCKAPESKKKESNAAKGNDRRKQSLVELDIPCAVMVRNKPPATSHQDNDSDCEVLDSANSAVEGENSFENVGPMDNADVQSETGSNFCEIIEEGSTLLDFKKLHVLARRVALPSTLWACHIDPLSHFVSFTRFNPDFVESGSNLVDRAVVFMGSMKPMVFCKGETSSLPEEINTFETLTDVAQALQHLNAMVLP